MTRKILTVVVALLVAVGLGAVVVTAGGSGSTVTRARLERSLTATFANVYATRARIQGRSGVTPASLHARAMCGKHGAENVDIGPGGDWVCLMSWTDPEVPMPTEGYGKFELNVHSNDCYTASAPSKLTGFLTMTDVAGREVMNPVFEFDSCFDPAGTTTPTGVVYPSLLTVTSTSLTRDADGRTSVQVTCGTGAAGCSGRISATLAGHGAASLGGTTFDLREESSATLVLPAPVPAGAGELAVDVRTDRGIGPGGPTTLAVS